MGRVVGVGTVLLLLHVVVEAGVVGTERRGVGGLIAEGGEQDDGASTRIAENTHTHR